MALFLKTAVKELQREQNSLEPTSGGVYVWWTVYLSLYIYRHLEETRGRQLLEPGTAELPPLRLSAAAARLLLELEALLLPEGRRK